MAAKTRAGLASKVWPVHNEHTSTAGPVATRAVSSKRGSKQGWMASPHDRLPAVSCAASQACLPPRTCCCSPAGLQMLP